MDRHGITAVPVVETGTNRLIGTISLKDCPKTVEDDYFYCLLVFMRLWFSHFFSSPFVFG
jgi:hypothetical protein